MDKNLLDNMSGQELKEMINDEIITLEDLDNTALEKILDFETDMLCFGTGDMTTIRRCSELLNKRNDSDVLNKDKIISIIDKVKREHVIIVDEEKTQESKAKVIRGKHIILRRIGLVAAFMAVLMSLTVLVAAAFGVNVFEYIQKTVRLGGGSLEVDSVTFYHSGETKDYASIEELIETEDLDILYPEKLPEGIYITKVKVDKTFAGKDAIKIYTNDVGVCITIEFATEFVPTSLIDTYHHNDMCFYFDQVDSNIAHAYCLYKDNAYCISAHSKDDLIFIINNLKE